jgi:hypothetical protein
MNAETPMTRGGPPLTTLEKVLVFVLRWIGVVDLLAIVAVFMPFSWSAEAHAKIGLGPLPEIPVMVYLIRSASLLYAAHAALILFVSRDVRRYSRFISFMGVVALVHGTILLVIDYQAGVPKWWMAGEPAAYWAMAAAIQLLQDRIRRARAHATQLMLTRSA